MSITKAIEFSAKAHEGHFRKGSKIPYITHPLEVAKILGEAVNPKENEALICAGLLHDTVEDTDTSLETIRREFGEKVADLVASDSENKGLSWEKRKQNTIDFLKNRATREMQMLACADKLANLRSVKADYERIGDDIWDIFVRGKEKQAWYYKGVLAALAPLSDLEMYAELRALIQEVFD
ncbi:HD domain-containing protein [uncultured Acetobacterium sp.]|uniref:HD domain-containing protein n=1 Tax=uncultured Acetobacterium sp. TaxID=217139 RepID=UPI0025FA135A|nr:HD domain-containing protein [uncultured Acetobacterium sp.]